jgi:hypothetical protein
MNSKKKDCVCSTTKIQTSEKNVTTNLNLEFLRIIRFGKIRNIALRLK